MVKRNLLYLIDFDWGGKAGGATYPAFMNHAEIPWANGVGYGKALQQAHNNHLLNTLFK